MAGQEGSERRHAQIVAFIPCQEMANKRHHDGCMEDEMTPESPFPRQNPCRLDGPHRLRRTNVPSRWTESLHRELGGEDIRISLRRQKCAPTGPLTKADWSLRFQFSSLVLYTRESLNEGLKQIEWDLLGFALLGTSIDVQNHLLTCLDARMREIVRVFMGHLTGIPEREVSLAQRLVLEQILATCVEKSFSMDESH